MNIKHLPQGLKAVLVLLMIGVLVFFSFKYKKLTLQGSLSQGIVGTYSKKTLPQPVTALISSPLVSLDEKGSPVANLAKNWQVEDDSKVYIFALKDDLYWHDGTKLQSSQIDISIPDVEVSFPDENTIKFRLPDSFVPFPTLLTFPILKKDSLIGVGKYKVKEVFEDRGAVTKLILVPNEDVKNELSVVKILFYGDESRAKTAFELGEVDSLFALNETYQLLGQPGVVVRKIVNFNKMVAVFYNTQDSLFSEKNKSFRKALTNAIPKVEDEELAKGPLPFKSWAYNDEIKDMTANMEVAKKYLQRADVPKNSKIVLTTIPNLAALGERIVSQWQELGIDVSLKIESGNPQNFQVLLTTQSLPTDPDQYPLWHSTQSKTNLAKYSSPRIDKDLEDGRKLADLTKRKEKYFDFQRVLVEDAPAAFLYFPKFNVIYRKKIESNLNKILTLQIQQEI